MVFVTFVLSTDNSFFVIATVATMLYFRPLRLLDRSFHGHRKKKEESNLDYSFFSPVSLPIDTAGRT
jgi:hypothetical protein